ncbi:PilW family protein [Microbacterium azadirachtae]|uniref:Prepilin-type N-terminal cleavage/methylation domain-containing protein n=1 Tax=Microbacterium azadirachtae TaxID=582680 RepID=A0A0F0LM54_9MICO|nr:hypothetical protein [Microbacterium azadirachtae]KJL34297.1 hypothetical protein RS86_01084 [Microbacterium azadirachtae]
MNAPIARDDDGLSLIELIFYVVILGLITTGIAVVFFNMWRAQASVSDQTDATERGQLVATQIEKAMRNAVAFEVTDASSTPGLSTGPVLLVATGLTGQNACMAFNFSAGQAQVIQTSGSSIAASSWSTWQTGIVSAGGAPYFKKTANSSASIDYSFAATSKNGPTVQFGGTAYMRTTSGRLPGGGTQTCFAAP